MQQERNFWVVGGDLRHRALARLLREEGHTVHLSAVRGEGLSPEPLSPAIRLAHCVILPLPVTGPGGTELHAPLSDAPVALAGLLDLLEPGQLLCGGMVSPELTEEAARRGLRLADYYEREECKVANAVPTVVAVGPTRFRG
jgi:dipicolinate synthase subunit A